MAEKKAPKKPAARRSRSKRAPKPAAADTSEAEPLMTSPEVTMSGAEIDRLRDRLRRKFH